MDRNYYAEHLLTLARHPSVTNERRMVRLLAFALHADEPLNFTKGAVRRRGAGPLQASLINEIKLWVDVVLSDEGRLRNACSRAKQIHLSGYPLRYRRDINCHGAGINWFHQK